MNWFRWTCELYRVGNCSHFYWAVLCLLDEGNQRLRVKESLVLYVNEMSSSYVQYGPASINYWMWIARPKVFEFLFKTAKGHSIASIKSDKNVSISVKIRAKSVLQTFSSAMVAALGVQKLQEDSHESFVTGFGRCLGPHFEGSSRSGTRSKWLWKRS